MYYPRLYSVSENENLWMHPSSDNHGYAYGSYWHIAALGWAFLQFRRCYF